MKRMVIKLERSILWGKIPLGKESKNPGDYVTLYGSSELFSMGGSITSFRIDTPDQGTIVTSLSGALATVNGYGDIPEIITFEGESKSTLFKDEINRAQLIPASWISKITGLQERIIWEESEDRDFPHNQSPLK